MRARTTLRCGHVRQSATARHETNCSRFKLCPALTTRRDRMLRIVCCLPTVVVCPEVNLGSPQYGCGLYSFHLCRTPYTVDTTDIQPFQELVAQSAVVMVIQSGTKPWPQVTSVYLGPHAAASLIPQQGHGLERVAYTSSGSNYWCRIFR